MASVNNLVWRFDGLDEVLAVLPEEYEFAYLNPLVFQFQIAADIGRPLRAWADRWLRANISPDESVGMGEIRWK